VTNTAQPATLVSAAASSPCQASGGRGPPARGMDERDVRMPREKPCAPGHGLGMCNDARRTDRRRHEHQALQAVCVVPIVQRYAARAGGGADRGSVGPRMQTEQR
jgi:hypothetical protein